MLFDLRSTTVGICSFHREITDLRSVLLPHYKKKIGIQGGTVSRGSGGAEGVLGMVKFYELATYI